MRFGMQLELYRALEPMASAAWARIHEKIRADNSTHDKERIREDFYMDEPLERKKPNTAAAVKALDVLDKRIASGEISDHMLLRIAASLGKSTAALRDEAPIEQLEAATYAGRIWQKALDLLNKRIASREMSDSMLLLRIAVDLGKSTADLLKWDRHPWRR
jgi:hypothetical protein